jgi:hypothetical protein
MGHDFTCKRYTNLNFNAARELKQWKASPDWRTLLELNKKYILGMLSVHPAHSDDVFDESEKVENDLLKMNDLGLFTIQGQPRRVGGGILSPEATAHFFDDHWNVAQDLKEAKPDDNMLCRTCIREYYPLDMWCQERQLAYVQFCVLIDEPFDAHYNGETGECQAVPCSENTASFEQVLAFAHFLLKDKRLHSLISWPKDSCASREIEKLECQPADLEVAQSYIPASDLNMYEHTKSLHGNSCTHDMRIAPTKAGLKTAEWQKDGGPWPEVCDIHLLRPRMPEWFFREGKKPVFFHVNAYDWTESQNFKLEDVIIQAAQAAWFPHLAAEQKSIVEKVNSILGQSSEYKM